jgi:hypothetical protein
MTDPDDRCGMGDLAIVALAAGIAATVVLVAWRWMA